eukprot:m.126419 g.126419  ORF g.126419 m.126419 type:complete len:161 (+) comp11189_c0_seq4:185-667(+)
MSSAMKRPLDFNQYQESSKQVSSSAHRVRFVTSGRRQVRKRYFTKELAMMMYGFGDVRAPVDASVEVLEDIVCEFISTVVSGALKSARRKSGKSGFKIEDLLFHLRSDRKKYLRIKDFVKRYEEISDTRKALEVDKADLGNLDKKALAREEKEKEKDDTK